MLHLIETIEPERFELVERIAITAVEAFVGAEPSVI
jgi:hypothetical protein